MIAQAKHPRMHALMWSLLQSQRVPVRLMREARLCMSLHLKLTGCCVQLEGGACGVRHPAGVPGILPICGHSGRLAHHVWRLRCACSRPPGGHGSLSPAPCSLSTHIPRKPPSRSHLLNDGILVAPACTKNTGRPCVRSCGKVVAEG